MIEAASDHPERLHVAVPRLDVPHLRGPDVDPADDDRPTLLPPGGQNPVGITLGLLGDEWTLLILRDAVVGVRHYSDWMERLPISNSVLAGRLARLTGAGLLHRTAYQQRPERFEYRLTTRGREVWPVLLGVWAWELAWVPDHAETLPRMRHRPCGHFFEPVLVCGACERPVGPRDVVGGSGPSGTWERSVPTGATRRRPGPAPGHEAGFVPQTMALIGNRWSSALLGAAFSGAHRFRDFEQQLSAPPAIVADRLRTFCELGVMAPAPGADRPDRTGYRLTDKGRAFFPVVVHAVDWGQRWFRSPDGPALLYSHPACGAAFRPRFACSGCSTLLRANAIERILPG